jgi:hypothetical protein
MNRRPRLRTLPIALLVLLASTGLGLAGERFLAPLSGDAQVPPVATDASGIALFELSDDETVLRYELHVFDVDDTFAAHIHEGAPGMNGPVRVTLSGGPVVNPVTGTVDVDEAFVEDLRAGLLYVNVHSQTHPPGVVRGQMGPGEWNSVQRVFAQRLSPLNEVPPVEDLAARGLSTVGLDLRVGNGGEVLAGSLTFSVVYGFAGAVTIVGLHVHEGASDVNGPVVVNADSGAIADPDGSGLVTFPVHATSARQLEVFGAILADPLGYYVNLHTIGNPAGALRDQVGSVLTHAGP